MTGPTGYDLAVTLYYNGQWNPVPAAAVHEGPGVTTYRGYSEEGVMRPCEIRLRILDDNLDYDPDNPRSPLFGLIGRRTPIRVAVGGQFDAAAEVASWRPGMTADWAPGPPPRGYRYVDVQASGLLRRIGNWAREVQSPMRRQLQAYNNPVGYWTMEDIRGAGSLSNLTGGGAPAAADGVNLGGATPPGGSASLAAFTASSIAYGVFGYTGTSAWQVAFVIGMSGVTQPAAPAYNRPVAIFTGLGLRWTLQTNADGFGLQVLYADGSVAYTNATTWSAAGISATRWLWFRISASHANGVVQFRYAAHTEGYTYIYQVTGSFNASGLGRLSTWQAACEGMGLGHLIALNNVTDDLMSTDMQTAVAGQLGETALNRFARLCAQEGIPALTVGDPATSQRMGGQGTDALIDLLKEATTTEDGLLYEDRASNALVLRSRRSLYAPSVLTLAYPAEIAPPFLPVTDDLDAANTVVVKHVDGAEATARVTGGPMDPAEVGEERREVTVNTMDPADVTALAQYYLNRFGLGGARYPSIVVDADVNPVKAATAAALAPGDIITVTGYRPAPIRLIVWGIATSTGTHRRQVTLVTGPADVYNVAHYDAATSRYDVAGCTTTAALPAAAPGASTTVGISSPGWQDGWSTTAVPYEVMIGVERVRVTAMSAAAGSGPRTQTATITRGIEGAAPAHPSGDVFRIADPVRWAR